MKTEIRPFWTVQAVFDPDGGGHDFAYTIGLATRGMAELHMWARPTDGEDPGADFKLSSRDLMGVLNGLAREWLDGDLRVGDQREVELDGGLNAAVITVGEACDAESLEALGARPALVIPLRWQLNRPPLGEPVVLTGEARELFGEKIRNLAARCEPRCLLPQAPFPYAERELNSDVDRPFGPLSDWVAINAYALMSIISLPTMTDLITDDSPEERCGLIVRMEAMSRSSGRDLQVQNVRNLALEAFDKLRQRRAWRNEVSFVAEATGGRRKDVQHNLEHFYRDFFIGVLTAAALEDVLPYEMRTAALASWRALLVTHAS